MKALDTNLLVRFLVRDDPVQAETVRALFEKEDMNGRAFPALPYPFLPPARRTRRRRTPGG